MNDKAHVSCAKQHNSKYMIRNHPILLQSISVSLADLSRTGTTHYLLEPVKRPQRRAMTALSAELPRTIVGLCSPYLFLFAGLLFFFSSICYSLLSYRLAPRVGRSVSEPGLLRPGKTRWSQTNKKAKSADAARLPIWFLSGGHQGNTRNAISKTSPLPFPPSFHRSPPCERYVLQMTEPSPNASKMLLFFFSLPLSSISLFPPLVSLCLEPAHMDWDQFRMK